MKIILNKPHDLMPMTFKFLNKIILFGLLKNSGKFFLILLDCSVIFLFMIFRKID